MKTNRFDEILRRKLESVKPDFQDQDWEKWQAFRQRATPTFWQTYRHGLGYAVATLTTAVMVILYVNQSNQNQDLLKEVQELKQQVATKNNAAGTAPDSASSDNQQPIGSPNLELRASQIDTVYVVERQTVYVERLSRVELTEKSEKGRIFTDIGIENTLDVPEKRKTAANQRGQENRPTPGGSLPANETADKPDSPILANKGVIEAIPPASIKNRQSVNQKNKIGESSSRGTLPASASKYEAKNSVIVEKSNDPERLNLGDIGALPAPAFTKATTNVQRRLQSRMPRPVRTAISDQRIARAESPGAVKQNPEEPASVLQTKKVTQDERLLPDFGLGLPFRIGVGQQWEGPTKSSGIWNEVLLGKHWSVHTGLSFQKLEDQKFYNDRIFREKTHENFRKKHAKPLPQNFEIFNITIATQLTKIPLNLNYRGDLGHGYSYFGGVGTQLNLRAKQTLSFDFKLPTNDFGEQKAERTVPFPLVNDVSVQVGAEKRWSPIVVQASLLLDKRLKTFPGLNDRMAPGLQVKLLYEMGALKKR